MVTYTACRRPFAPMLSLEDARAAILERIRPARTTETVPLAAALGRYLAAAPAARIDHPPFDNSAMDGYALALADLPPHRSLPVSGEAACGSAPARLAPGTTLRIFTGAPMPAGADTIAIQEEVTRQGDRAVFPADLKPGRHLRRRGEDFRAGQRFFAPGHRVRAQDLALLATAGCEPVEVFRPPRVLVAATGDELVAPGRPLAPGQVYESNLTTTCGLLRELGIPAADTATVRDDADALRSLLDQARDYDFVITSGGASVGDHDLVRDLFAEVGEVSFWRARIKPGKPVAFGCLGERGHFFALPGNPVSSLVTFKLFVEPALVHWHHGRHPMPLLPARAAKAYRRRPGRREFLRARLVPTGSGLEAAPLAGQGSHQVAPLAEANGLIVVPEEQDGFDAGDAVQVMPLGWGIAP